MNITKLFVKYVSQNIIGMVGVSCYILADTFFISLAAGANGITALNLALPIYGTIFAIGSMLGVGSATQYAILRAKKDEACNQYFANGIVWICIASLPFMLMGLFAPEKVIMLMGGDQQIVKLASSYFRIFMSFTPAFMLNYIFQAFVRNDGEPTRAMAATLSGSIFNIIFDYIFMFPMGMGLPGAAVATSISPILGIVISATHFATKNNTLSFDFKGVSVRKMIEACKLGIASFVAEISSAVTTTVFNFLLLGLVGNVAVAAYGVIANVALVAVAIFNGTAQGMQPLISNSYGRGEKAEVSRIFRLGIITAVGIAIFVIGITMVLAPHIVSIFNSEHSADLANFAEEGIRLYFMGYIFAGFNIVATGFFGATAKAKEAFVASVMRGFVAIVIVALLMSRLWGMQGVWLSFVISEGLTTLLIIAFLCRARKK